MACSPTFAICSPSAAVNPLTPMPPTAALPSRREVEELLCAQDR
jgi:hypothetical protein